MDAACLRASLNCTITECCVNDYFDRATKETLETDLLDQDYLLHVMEWSVGEVSMNIACT